ncbi:nuclease-related domain-containing protein, partial [Bacillus amyloliquefaciens]
NYKILFNLVLPNNRNVDMVILHEAGIFVTDIKNLGGWIFGREQDSLWAQALHKDKLIKFNNPIIDTKLAILDLKEV